MSVQSRGVANTAVRTGQERGSGACGSRCRIVRKLAVGHLLPFARREIDGRAVAGIATAHPRRKILPHQRRTGPISSAAPSRSVRKPGRNSNSPASTVRNPPVLAWMPAMSVSATATRKRAIPPRPARRSTRIAGQRGRQHQQQAPSPARRCAATRIKATISASGSNRMAVMIHFTMAGVSVLAGEVGAGAGIVYGRSEATLPAVSTDAPLYGCSRVPTL